MDARDKLGVVAAVAALVVLYFVSGSPISLYSYWQDTVGLTKADMSLASMWYLLGTVVPLLFMSRISDHMGRKPATVLILLIALCGAMTFAMVESPAMIQAGRLIQGIASGLGSSTVAAYVVDLSTGLPKWVGPTITSSAPNVGLALGAFASGSVVTFTDSGTSAYFEGAAVAVAVIAVLVLLARETVPRKPGLIRSLAPRLTLPKGCLRIYAASAMVFIATWAVGSFSQSFSAVIVSETTGSENAFLSAAVYVTLLLPVVVGSFFSGRFDTRAAQRWGLGIYVFFVVLMYIALFVCGSLLWFCILSVLAAIAQGVAFTAGVSALIGRAKKEERAGTFSTIYLTSYGGAAIPSLVVGMFGGDCATGDIMLCYVALIIVMFLVLLALTHRPFDEPGSSESRDGLELEHREPLEEQLLLAEDLHVPSGDGVLEGALLHERRDDDDDPPVLLEMLRRSREQLRERAEAVRPSGPRLGEEALLVHGEVGEVEHDGVEPSADARVDVGFDHIYAHAVPPGVPARELHGLEVDVPGGHEAEVLGAMDGDDARSASDLENLLAAPDLEGFDEEPAVVGRGVDIRIGGDLYLVIVLHRQGTTRVYKP